MPRRSVLNWAGYYVVMLAFLMIQSAIAGSGLQLKKLEPVGDPLPFDRLNCMYRDRHGLLWLGTQRGLVGYHFTGMRWFKPDPSNPTALLSGDISAISEDASGQLWIGTTNGIHVLDRGKGRFIRANQLFANQNSNEAKSVSVLYSDRVQRFWVGTSAGLYKMNAEGQSKLQAVELLKGRWVTAILEDAGQNIWVSTLNHGLYRLAFNQKEWQKVETDWQGMINKAVITSQGFLWIADKKALLKVSIHSFRNQNPLVFEEVVTTTVESLEWDGTNLWFGGKKGLWRINQQERQQEMLLESVGEDEDAGVNTIFADRFGLVWVRTVDGGLYFWNQYRDHWFFDAMDEAEVWALEPDGRGGLWVGTKNKGLQHLSVSGERLQPKARGVTVRDILRLKNDDLWIAINKGLLRLKAGEEKVKPVTKLNKRVWRLLQREDRIWLGMDDGLWFVSARQPDQRFREPWLAEVEGLSQAPVTAIRAAGPHQMWVGTFSKGLFHIDFQKQQVRAYNRNTQPALPSNEVLDVFLDSDQNAWISSVSGGLSRIDPKGSLQLFNTASGFPDHAIVGICEDVKGRLWANAGVGLICFSKNGNIVSVFREVEGVLRKSATPGAILAEGNRIWFGGIGGLMMAEAQTLPEIPSSPVVLTSFRVDGQEVRQIVLPGETIEIQERAGTFSLNLAMMNPYHRHWGPWQYRRESQETSWIQLEENALRLGRYLPLGGKDRIHLSATDPNHRTNPFHLNVVFLPPWWRVWLPIWILLGVGCIVFITYGVVFMVERAKRRKLIREAQLAMARQKLAEERAGVAEKERELEANARKQQDIHMNVLQKHLEQMSTEMANDLHDGPLSELRGLMFQLSGLKKMVGNEAVLEKINVLNQQLLPSITKNLRNVCGQLVVPEFEEGLQPELEKYLNHLTLLHPTLQITERWEFEEASLNQESKRILFRIFRTLVKNVSDHAQATKLTVSLATEDGITVLTIEDNGVGFNVEETYEALRKNKHYGLYMTYFFAQGLGGSFQISGAADSGTTAIVRVPASAT